MRHPMALVHALVAVLVLPACTPTATAPPELTDAERAAIADSVGDQSEGWRSAAERLDVPGVLAHYSTAPGNALIRADKILVSREALGNELAANYATFRSRVVTPRDQRISVLTRDIVAEAGTGDWVDTDTTGVVINEQYAFSRVWVREAGGWRIFHTYIDIRPVAAPAADAPR